MMLEEINTFLGSAKSSDVPLQFLIAALRAGLSLDDIKNPSLVRKLYLSCQQSEKQSANKNEHRMNTKWTQSENEMNTKWTQNERKINTKWKQSEDKSEKQSKTLLATNVVPVVVAI